jgi:SAM-dependent methyltransferase
LPSSKENLVNMREHAARQIAEHYEKVWKCTDPWEFDASEYEQARYDQLLARVADRRYERILELGCGAGQFTRRLAGIADRVLALDVAPAAVERARAAWTGPDNVEFRAVDVMKFDLHAEGPWDLISFCETIYCVGWLYSFFDLGWLASELLNATAPGGRLLLANTMSERERDWLLRPWLVNTYRDLFCNVGYRVESEEELRGVKDGVSFAVLCTLFEKPRVTA